MGYGASTSKYLIPTMVDGDQVSESEEFRANRIIENQLRAGILGAGGTRVFAEGTYSVVNDTTNEVVTVLLEGNPALRGIANDGLVEVFADIVWSGLEYDELYYLYVQATPVSFEDPSNVNVVSSTSPITQTDHLLLATIDTTDAGTTAPTLDESPTGKATGSNLFELLNNGVDPFGTTLTQSILHILAALTVRLGVDRTMLVAQQNPTATLPVISIENASSQPDIKGALDLIFADSRIVDGFALSDDSNPAYTGTAVSIVGALNEILGALNLHIADNTDPHGTTLTQTNLTVLNDFTASRIVLDPDPSQEDEIHSNGRLRIADTVAALNWTEDAETPGSPPGGPPPSPPSPFAGGYQGTALSVIGALNELWLLLVELSSQQDDIIGTTLPPISPVSFEIVPDDVGQNLHFRVEFATDDTFSTLDTAPAGSPPPPPSPPASTLYKSTRESVVGWYVEYVPELPAGDFSPQEIEVLTHPKFIEFPAGGLPLAWQSGPNDRSLVVQYRPQTGDNLYLSRLYRVAIQQDNGITDYPQRSVAAINTVVFGG